MVKHRPAGPSWVWYCPYQFAKSRIRPWGRRSDFLAIVMTESSTFSDSNLHPSPQAFCLRDSDLASLPTKNEALKHTVTCTPVASQCLLQAIFKAPVRAPAIGSILSGAEIFPFPALSQDTPFISLSSLLADFWHSGPMRGPASLVLHLTHPVTV